MKRIFLLALIMVTLSLFVQCVHADVYIKQHYHSDGFYNYGQMTPEENRDTGFWIGNKKMTYITGSGKLVFLQKQKILYVVNDDSKSYVEVALPVDIPKSFEKRVLSYYSTDQSGGSVKNNGEKKSVGKWQCNGYDINFWVEDQGSRFEDQVEKRWFTTDVPFDVKMYQTFSALRYDLYHSILHWDKDYVTLLKKIEGFPVLSEIKIYVKGKPRNAKKETLEMKEKTPPADIYSIPAGYKRAEKLKLADWGIIH
ncbi:MAG: hypothetical protein GY757_05455 [bacterium]|nr:hypothetical protein [bacterium]